jgi:hypothetical protein
MKTKLPARRGPGCSSLLNLFRAVCACYLLHLASSSIQAGTIHLSVAGPSPDFLIVLTNEPITFVADDAAGYAVVSYNWAAGTLYLPTQGSTRTVTLAFSGVYNYEDGRGGYGIIYVNIPPTCKITNPTNSAVFAAPASFNFTVEARNFDSDKLIGVDFWLDGTYLDGKLMQPFTVPVSDLGPGTHTLRAVAVDYSYATAEHSVTITVLPPTLQLSNARKAGNQFIFAVSGLTAGRSVVLEGRSSLANTTNWVALQTNVATGTTLSLTNPISAGAAFFRAVQLP